jgi:hypothetical protein
MMRCRTHRRFATVLALGLALAAVAVPAVAAQDLPDRLSDADFWSLVRLFSEQDRYFRSDNLLSNETGYQLVIPELQRTVRPGGVYLGVGPEQNFTYISALRPGLAFILDMRDDNKILQLMYKALFEMSTTRADFLARLFSRPRPPGLDTGATAQTLFAAFARTPPDSGMESVTFETVRNHLLGVHGFVLTNDELRRLSELVEAFYENGPGLNYFVSLESGGSVRPWSTMPDYAQLMTATDPDGVPRSFLATEENYRVVRDLQVRNLIIPLVGDFAGQSALRSVGNFVRSLHAVVNVFYTSNVEQYLWIEHAEADFYNSVRTLPLDSSSTFIRSSGGGFRGGGMAPGGGGMRYTLLGSIKEFLHLLDIGRIQAYQDVLTVSH